MSAARKALRGASERHGEGVPRWRGRSYLSVSVKTQKHTLAFTTAATTVARSSCFKLQQLLPTLIAATTGVRSSCYGARSSCYGPSIGGGEERGERNTHKPAV
ncbi:unnamed protein product [Pleuronectes platessa]|uniref:Uncharacterized protein n=1 Tax=Pleuronectes platessa TaxID=8262 RepID=A0A9N7TK69_PLEPL|nr:unnamed protein product [Pleuronectes platessa]